MTIASRYGLLVGEPVTLSDSNNVVVWLAPSPVVAKVGTGHHKRLGLELSVARHLVTLGAPVVPPADELPEEVHTLGRFEATFWKYQAGNAVERADPQKLGLALLELHGALGSYPEPLPSLGEELAIVREVLADPAGAVALSEADRNLLLAGLDRFSSGLARRGIEERPLHGSPHESNMITIGDDVRFIDFETASTGPLEWNLAHVAPQALAFYAATFDPGALDLCRALVSVKTAAWCWSNVEHPDLRWHAEHHLSVVKALME